MNCPACTMGDLVERPQLSTWLRTAYVCERCKRGFLIPNAADHGLGFLPSVLTVLTLGILDFDVLTLEE